MNPDAKEFVPAHILKKRQEESERLGELTDQLEKVDIKSGDSKEAETKECPKDKSNQSSEHVQNNSSDPQNVDDSKAKKELRNCKPTSSDIHNEQPARGPKENGQSLNNNNAHGPSDYQDSNEGDRYLLNAGENFCEFNGEQFIIPGDDDDLQPPARMGYDFGNEEDNEDEDIANAYEEFLDTLPNN